LERLLGEATPAPWEAGDGLSTRTVWMPDGMFARVMHWQDAALIAEARNALPVLLAVARAAEDANFCDEPSCTMCRTLRDALAPLDPDTADTDETHP
jgi:hypothetical protein